MHAEYFLKWVLERHPESLEAVDNEGTTVLHSWVKIGEIWPFKYILESTEIDPKWRSHFIKLISYPDYKDQNNPLHVAATTTNEATDKVVKLLIEAYREEYPSWRSFPEPSLPWLEKNKAKEGALSLAIRNQREKLALYILSLYNAHLNSLLDYYEPEHGILFLAIEKNCSQVAKVILNRLDRGSWSKYLMDSSDERNILHLTPNCTGEITLIFVSCSLNIHNPLKWGRGGCNFLFIMVINGLLLVIEVQSTNNISWSNKPSEAAKQGNVVCISEQ